MFIHIGEKNTLCIKEIICILSANEILEKNEEFFYIHEKYGKIRYVTDKTIRSYIVTDEGFIYCSSINSKTLKRRVDEFYNTIERSAAEFETIKKEKCK